MENTLIIRLSLAGAFFLLAGCTTPNQAGSDADKVIEGTRRACSFVPTATSILAILNVPGAPAADKLVQKICEQVGRSAMVESSGVGDQITVEVDGKEISGVLTKK
ncbi:MAG: hypothetical protein E5Y67_07165 [Mesorhizobium sp.]|uniref:hypothetical protein n=1 Tax=Mesorhizobium sp. TaxID=1871066 RepID=UPI00121A12E6|nr:hypothetical protein [Mesorhizobium sp.]TIM15514.1 MAG: hypothetical protein E5Y67_07165 [Mesorhizobium sp.]